MDEQDPKLISWENFFEQLVTIQIQFRTAQRALKGYVESPEMLKAHAEEQLQEIREMMHEGAKKQAMDPLSTWAYDEAAIAKFLETAKENAIRTLGDAGGRMQQYQYIIQVALLEGLLKDIHRAILLEAPTLLKEDRQVPLGKLIAKGQDEILREEVEREVQALDRKSVKEKADYFEKRLGISWFGGTIVPIFEYVIQARNEMLHENPDRMIGEKDILFLNLVMMGVPVATLAQASLLYPHNFAPPMNITEKDARKFLPGAEHRLTSGTDA